MTLIAYEHINFHAKSQRMIDIANEIIDEFRADGYTLTLRQLYYQFVAHDLIANKESEYKKLSTLMTKARMCGQVSWTAIEDRGRNLSAWSFEEDEQEVLSGVEYGLILDLWERQNTYVEVWVEKDALSSVIARPCNRWRVPYMSCKGYSSASEMWRAGQRFERHADLGQHCVLIHLGDHDPSGLDMTRDNQSRLDTFAGQFCVDVRRIALNRDQIDEHNPPPNPTKVTDSRAPEYMALHGSTCWELDALKPQVIDKLITDEITGLVDVDKWRKTKEEEQERRKHLEMLHERWDEVRDHLIWLDDEDNQG